MMVAVLIVGILLLIGVCLSLLVVVNIGAKVALLESHLYQKVFSIRMCIRDEEDLKRKLSGDLDYEH